MIFFPLALMDAAPAVNPAVDTLGFSSSPQFWFWFCGALLTVLAVTLLILQIKRELKRHPPITEEIDMKLGHHKQEVKERLDGFDGRIERIEDEERAGRSRIYQQIEGMRKDMDGKFREIGEKTAAQQSSIDLMNQTQVRMDGKIDLLLRRDK